MQAFTTFQQNGSLTNFGMSLPAVSGSSNCMTATITPNPNITSSTGNMGYVFVISTSGGQMYGVTMCDWLDSIAFSDGTMGIVINNIASTASSTIPSAGSIPYVAILPAGFNIHSAATQINICALSNMINSIASPMTTSTTASTTGLTGLTGLTSLSAQQQAQINQFNVNRRMLGTASPISTLFPTTTSMTSSLPSSTSSAINPIINNLTSLATSNPSTITGSMFVPVGSQVTIPVGSGPTSTSMGTTSIQLPFGALLTMYIPSTTAGINTPTYTNIPAQSILSYSSASGVTATTTDTGIQTLNLPGGGTITAPSTAMTTAINTPSSSSVSNMPSNMMSNPTSQTYILTATPYNASSSTGMRKTGGKKK